MRTASVAFVGVTKTYRHGHVTALHDLTFAVRPGEAVAFIGPSGAGKTTLLRLLNRFLVADRGHVLVDGRDVAALSPREMRALRRVTGVIYQQHNLVKQLRVLHNVLAGRLGTWPTLASIGCLVIPTRAQRDLAAHALGMVGLAGREDVLTNHLSGGEQQRVAVARMLVQNPALILADEPVASLDPASATTVLETLMQLHQYEGKTLLVSLHNVDLVRRYFPRAIGLVDGQMVFDGVPDDLDATVLATIYGRQRDEAYHQGSANDGQAGQTADEGGVQPDTEAQRGGTGSDDRACGRLAQARYPRAPDQAEDEAVDG